MHYNVLHSTKKCYFIVEMMWGHLEGCIFKLKLVQDVELNFGHQEKFSPVLKLTFTAFCSYYRLYVLFWYDNLLFLTDIF